MHKVIKAMIVAFIAIVVVNIGVVSAFDPSGYTGNGTPQFNAYTEVEGWGDEKDFLRVGSVSDKFTAAVNTKEACEGEVKVFVYVHNDAAEENNGTNNDGTGVAHDTKVKVHVPSVTDNTQKLTAVISASNAPSVTDDTFITCGNEKIKVEYVKDSAEVVTLKSAMRKLNNSIVDGGALIGTEANDGIVPGCWEYRNYVSLRVKITKVTTPPTTPPVTPPTTPPTTLPKTGAGDVIGLFAATSAVGAVAHNVISRRRASN
jgi:hypothetical protein